MRGKKKLILPLFIIPLVGCAFTPETVAPPSPRVVTEPLPRKEKPTKPPLIIEVVLLPEPGGPPCSEAPASRSEYVSEIKECCEIGASMVRLQPLAGDSSRGSYRFDRSLENYRALFKEILQAVPAAIIDLDIHDAPEEVSEWAGCNARIECTSAREKTIPLISASGEFPLQAMKRAIASGGHVRLGLHESLSWPYKGKPTNLDYLRQAVSMAKTAGRPVATPEEARGILKLRPLSRAYAVPSSRSVKKGDSFMLEALAGPLAQPFTAYAILQTPTGVTYSLTKKGKPYKGIRPFLVSYSGMKKVSIVTLVDTVIAPGMPPGKYAITLGLFPRHIQPVPRHAISLATTEVTVR